MRCCILSRVSTITQTLEQQTSAIIKQAIADGFSKEDMIIIENKESVILHDEEEINGLNEMKQYIESDSSITCVYAYEISRISRKPKVLYSVRDYLQEHRVQLVVITPPFRLFNEQDFSVNDGASVIFALFAQFAETEIRLKKERTERGRRFAMQQGKIISGHPIFGYKLNKDGYAVIDEDNSKYVTEIFEMYASDIYSIRAIAKEFADRGVMHSKSLSAMSNIGKILNDKRYTGNTIYYPRIISDELFSKVQANLAKGLSRPKVCTKNIYYCHNILFNEEGVKFLADPHNTCYQIKKYYNLSINIMDTLSWELTKQRRMMFMDTNKDEELNKLKKNISIIETKIKNKKKNIDDLRQQIQNIEIRLIRGRLNEKTAESLQNTLEKEIDTSMKTVETLTAELEHANNLFNTYSNKINNIYDELESITDDSIRSKMVHEEIKKIIVKRDSRTHVVCTYIFTINDEKAVFDLFPYNRHNKVYLSGIPYEINMLKRFVKKKYNK